ncbi:MAG TPA: CCA tRNA nucleotidyltransferase [Xanthobacteraceae bacterium]|nr:CCA tRNA nucleotidyltransferase [Xanthobacteraceae bacterium]
MSQGATRVLAAKERAWLEREPLARLLDVLDADAEEARVVGGAVRNTLLGLAVNEVDIATTAVPDEVVRRAGNAGFHPVPTGIEHGTVTVVIGGKPFEVTTLREDIETFGRHAKVRFGRDWKKDAERRDFTINALFLARDGRVSDFVGGLADLEARRVRFIGDPATRIREDYLRVLRFFRFHAAYAGGAMDAAGLAACIAARAEIASLSRERVRAELSKLFLAQHAVPTLATMSEVGILGSVLGGVPLLASFANMMKAEHALGLEPDAIRRLAALAVFLSEDAERLRDRLRLANAEFHRLESMGDRWWQVSPARGEDAARALLYRIGAENFRDRALMAFSRSRAKADDKAWRDLVTLPARWSPPKFPLAAKDFTARGIEKGPALGAALARAEEEWIKAGFPAERSALDSIVEDALRAVKKS